MYTVLIIYSLPIVHLLYLMDIFAQEIQKRHYLKLYKNRKFLLTQLIISLAIIGVTLPLQLDSKNQNVSFSTLSLYFIAIAFILNKLSIRIQHRPYNFYLRGDNVKWISYDMLFSFLQFLLPWVLVFLTELLLEHLNSN
jgi:uncharacterized membrane protein YoaK (UPF0700 family)